MDKSFEQSIFTVRYKRSVWLVNFLLLLKFVFCSTRIHTFIPEVRMYPFYYLKNIQIIQLCFVFYFFNKPFWCIKIFFYPISCIISFSFYISASNRRCYREIRSEFYFGIFLLKTWMSEMIVNVFNYISISYLKSNNWTRIILNFSRNYLELKWV